MAYQVTSLSRLAEQFARLPNVGRKTAQRYAFYVLSQPPEFARAFAEALLDSSGSIKRCSVCQNLSDEPVCSICQNQARDRSIICVVADPARRHRL